MKKTLLFCMFLMAISASASEGGGSSVGPANPAARNCLKLGGTIERVVAPNGAEKGNCVIKEWTLYGEMDDRGLVKEHHYGNGGMANPASVNCRDIGGATRIVETSAGQSGYCVIEEWKLFDVINVIEE